MHFTNLDARAVLRRVSLLLVAVLPLVKLPIAADPYQPVRALLVSLAAGCLLATAATSARKPRFSVAGWLLVALVVIALMSAVAAHPASSVFGVSGRFDGLVALFVLGLSGLAGARGRLAGAEARWLARALAVAIIVEALIVIGQRMNGADAVGTLGNAVLAAGWLVTSSAFVIGVSFGESGPWRAIELAASVLGVLAIGASGTRGAWLAVLVTLVLVVLYGGKVGRRVAAAALVLLAAAVLVLGGHGALEKLRSSDLAAGSAGSRWEIWVSTAHMIRARPFLGTGPGRYLYEFPKYETARHAAIERGDVRADQAHSLLLQQAAEEGVPSALVLVLLAALAFRAAGRAVRRGDVVALAALFGLSAFAAQALFGIPTMETDALAWFFGGLAIARGSAVANGTAGMRLNGCLAAFAAGVAALILWYAAADIMYRTSTQEFMAGRFDEAAALTSRSIAVDPLVDTYRVALADAVQFDIAVGSTKLADSAEQALARGLDLEPESFDLAASRARLLASIAADPAAVWAAYQRAMALYPLGVGIRQEAFAWAARAGSGEMQAEAAAELARVKAVTK